MLKDILHIPNNICTFKNMDSSSFQEMTNPASSVTGGRSGENCPQMALGQNQSLKVLSFPSIVKQQGHLELSAILAGMGLTDEQRRAVEFATRGQRENPMWGIMREGRITSSNFGVLLPALQSGREVSSSAISRLIEPRSLEHVPAIKWGIQNEEKARKAFEEEKQVVVQDSGLWLSKSGVLGASPDGLVGSTELVEIKCPYSARDMTIEEAVSELDYFFLEKVGEDYQLRQNHDYWHQIQGQIHIAGRDVCYFVVWTTKDRVIVPIKRDKEWQPNLQLLENFYESKLLPKLLNCAEH
ncbi:hypothetical protein COCON_G00104680 [Conger conger]|uniref:YqaJ viral recombinase domain-containing protein n=1 Tax=Conger conger TaxID=82655 RepID=A0A9Q1DIH7_CONCO|nr:hypothetical protein COCON_G00104680 [Conger conger]